MDTTVTNAQSAPVWGGGNKPLEASYGKMMMWFLSCQTPLPFLHF